MIYVVICPFTDLTNALVDLEVTRRRRDVTSVTTVRAHVTATSARVRTRSLHDAAAIATRTAAHTTADARTRTNETWRESARGRRRRKRRRTDMTTELSIISQSAAAWYETHFVSNSTQNTHNTDVLDISTVNRKRSVPVRKSLRIACCHFSSNETVE